MRKIYSKLENSVYYGFSRTFWHIISFLGVLAIIAGIMVFVWSFIPPSKKEIVKQDAPVKQTYPEQVHVSFEDVYLQIPKEASKIEEERIEIYNQPQAATTTKGTEINPEDLAAFNLQIAQLKTTIPEEKNTLFWKGKGHYVYLDERKYKITKSEIYRRFEYTSTGFENKFISYTDRKNIKNYTEKAKLLQALNNLVSKTDESKREQLLEQFMNKNINDLSQTINSVNSISNILFLFPKEDVLNAFENLYHTASIDSITDFLSNILASFPIEERYTTLKTIKTELRDYTSNIEEFKSITEKFIPLLPKFPVNQQAVALKYYYKTYKFKNQDRLREINQIDQEHLNITNQIEQDYLSQIAIEEANFYSKKAIKTDFKLKSLYGVGIGIAVIVIITIILLLLAMIRNVNRLAQLVIESKKTEN